MGTVVSKGQDVPCNMHYACARYTESEKWLIRKRSTDFSLSHDDVLLYVAGKNEDAIAVVLKEDRTMMRFSSITRPTVEAIREETAPKTN